MRCWRYCRVGERQFSNGHHHFRIVAIDGEGLGLRAMGRQCSQIAIPLLMHSLARAVQPPRSANYGHRRGSGNGINCLVSSEFELEQMRFWLLSASENVGTLTI